MNFTFIIMLAVVVGMMFFSQRTQKKQYQKRMDSLNRLEKGTDVVTIGGLYGTVDEVDTTKGLVVLDVDGVYLTFELAAIKKVLPQEKVEEPVAVETAITEESSVTEETAIEEVTEKED